MSDYKGVQTVEMIIILLRSLILIPWINTNKRTSDVILPLQEIDVHKYYFDSLF